MNTFIRIQKIYFLALRRRDVLSLVFFGVCCLYVSVWIDTPRTISDFYSILLAGVPYRDFSVLQILRFLFFYLFYLYFFSLSSHSAEKSDLYLLLIRFDSLKKWYKSICFYALNLGIIYWGLFLFFTFLFVLISSIFFTEPSAAIQLFFSKETALFYFENVLSSITLANLFLLLTIIFTEKNAIFSVLVFLLFSYCFSYFLVGKKEILFFNTSVLTLARTLAKFDKNNNLLVSLLWIFIQNLLIYIGFSIYLLNRSWRNHR